MELRDHFIPVIVGVGQLLDRPKDDEDGMEPLSLILNAIEIADKDSNGKFLSKIDSLDVENVSSWSYENLDTILCKKLNVNPAHCQYHDVSGDSPVRNLLKAAKRISEGKSEVALVCGGEAGWTVRRNIKNNHIPPSWTPFDQKKEPLIAGLPEIMERYGLHIPTTVYSLYENAFNHHMGLNHEQGQKETGKLWARASEIAFNNPYAWIHKIHTPQEIIEATLENRMISWPYTKLMVANNYVNGGTAVLLTNLALAKKARIPDDKIIYCTAGGFANETDDIFERDNYYHSAAMEAVLNTMVKNLKIDFIELYSCFPIVPKLAKRILNWSDDKDLSLVGGMTFCGGQLSNFMGQATVSMVEQLRKSPGNGVLYGNGHFLTHAAAIVLSSTKYETFPTDLDLQNQADTVKNKPPEFISNFEGKGTIETYTVVFNSNGAPDHGIVIGLTEENKRFVAKTKQGDIKTIEPLLNKEKSPMGMTGLSHIVNGFNIWRWD